MAPVRVVFIGGLGRSGTTLIERILGEIPGTVGVGEIVHLWQRDLRDGERCACSLPFLECPFWLGVGRRAFGGWQNVDVDTVLRLRREVDRTRHVPSLAMGLRARRHARALHDYTRHYERIYRAALEESGSQIVIDSSKHASLAYCLSHNHEIDLRVLHVVRDSRGVAYSWTKQISRPESDGKTMAAWSPSRSAMYWNAHNAAFAALPLSRRNVRLMTVKYEDFLANPLQTVQNISSFAGLALSASDLSFVRDTSVDLAPGHSAAGNPMRFRSGRLEMRRDEAWRSMLPPDQRRLVSVLTAPGLYAYGYLASR